MKIRIGGHAPVVHETAWLAPNATVIGQVTLAADASIWYNAVLRADFEVISVGAKSNIQDCCVVHRFVHLCRCSISMTRTLRT